MACRWGWARGSMLLQQVMNAALSTRNHARQRASLQVYDALQLLQLLRLQVFEEAQEVVNRIHNANYALTI